MLRVFDNAKNYLLEELFSQVVVPVVSVVVNKKELASVQVSDSPESIFFVWSQISNTGLLGWWNDLQMGSFINFFISNSVEVNSLDKQEFLY